jgi:hypothetical protein
LEIPSQYTFCTLTYPGATGILNVSGAIETPGETRTGETTMGQPRQPLADELEMGPDGKLRDTETGEVYGHIPIPLRDLYDAAPDLLRELQAMLEENYMPGSGHKRAVAARAAIAKAKGAAADDPGNAAASDAFLATAQKTCVKCNTPVSERGIDTDGGFHPGMACRRIIAASQGRPYAAKGGA